MHRELLRVRTASRRRAEADAAWIESVKTARAAGLSLAAIAREAAVTRGRIHQITREQADAD